MQGAFGFYRELPARPKRPERLFFALLPDTETSARVRRFSERFIRQSHLTGRQLEPERLHVSLHHVGDYDRLRAKFVYAAKQAGNAVSMRAFEMAFGSIKSFDGAPAIDGRAPRRPLVLLGEGDALPALHDVLGAAMRKNGLRPTAHFMPHMTLFYGSRPIAVQPIEPIRFMVDQFALVHSERGLTHYNVIDRWPLEP